MKHNNIDEEYDNYVLVFIYPYCFTNQLFISDINM